MNNEKPSTKAQYRFTETEATKNERFTVKIQTDIGRSS